MVVSRYRQVGPGAECSRVPGRAAGVAPSPNLGMWAGLGFGQGMLRGSVDLRADFSASMEAPSGGRVHSSLLAGNLSACLASGWAAFMAILFTRFGDLSRIRSLSPRGIVALLYLAIPGLALGQWFWQEGVAKLGATRAGLYLYLEPLATLMLALPLLNEPFGPSVALGGGLVLAGVYVGQRETRRQN